MFLRTLKLRNYRKFRDEIVEFSEGIIGIIGPNGVGKSSILEAIGWALYGNVITRSDKFEVKSQNAADDENCKVELEFDLGGHAYKIERELKGKSAISNALVYLDGGEEPIAQRDSGVNQYIENLLGMDYVTFLRTVYAKQKDLAALSTLRPEERKKVIRRMLNIDRIDLAVTQIRTDEREKNKFIEGLQTGLEDINKLEEARKDIVDSQKENNKSLEEHTSNLKDIIEDKEKIKKDKENQEAKYKIFNSVNKETSRLDTQKASLEKKLKELIEEREELEQKNKSLQKIESKEQEYIKAKREKEELETLRVQYQEKIGIEDNIRDKKDDLKGRENKLKTLKKNFKGFAGVQEASEIIEKKIQENEKIRRRLEKESKGIEGQVQIYKSQIRELSSKKKNISQLGKNGKCPICFRELGDNYENIIEHLNEDIKKIKQKLDPIQETSNKIDKQFEDTKDEIDKLVVEKNKLGEKLRKKSKIEQSLQEQQEEIENLKSKIGKEEEKLNKLKDIKFDQEYYEKLVKEFKTLSGIRDNILELRKEIQRIPKIEETIAETKRELSAIASQLAKVKGELEKLDFNEKKFEKTKSDYESINEKLLEEQKKLSEARSQLEVSEQKLLALEEKISCQKKSRKMIEETRKELQYLQRLQSLLEIFRIELTGRIRPLLETRASYLFNEITDGRYPSIELNEDYEMSILDGNRAYGLKRFSGGEEDLANLCLRIAMSQVIAERSGGVEINFIALDEIFGSQDEDRRQNILNSLNRLSSQFRQIFLITHIADIKEMLSRVLQIEENMTTKESKTMFG